MLPINLGFVMFCNRHHRPLRINHNLRPVVVNHRPRPVYHPLIPLNLRHNLPLHFQRTAGEFAFLTTDLLIWKFLVIVPPLAQLS